MNSRVAASAVIFFASFASATARDIVTDIAKCRSEAEDARRLRCYDDIAKTADSTVPKVTQADFGVSNGPIAAQQSKARTEPQEMIAKAVIVAKKTRGELVVTLDNDQVWQQLQPSSLRLQAGDAVTIKEGSLGSFILVAPSGRGTKVQRVK
jgi:hypothetical protein